MKNFLGTTIISKRLSLHSCFFTRAHEEIISKFKFEYFALQDTKLVPGLSSAFVGSEPFNRCSYNEIKCSRNILEAFNLLKWLPILDENNRIIHYADVLKNNPTPEQLHQMNIHFTAQSNPVNIVNIDFIGSNDCEKNEINSEDIIFLTHIAKYLTHDSFVEFYDKDYCHYKFVIRNSAGYLLKQVRDIIVYDDASVTVKVRR